MWYIESHLNSHYGKCNHCGWRRGMLNVVKLYKDGQRTEHFPTIYGDGSLGWDWPERIPERIRKLATKAASLSNYSGDSWQRGETQS